MLETVMKRWPVRKLVALFLAVLIPVGMSLSVVPTSGISAKMPMSSDLVASTHDGCQGCPNCGGDDGMKAMTCRAVCAAPVLAVLPDAASIPAVQKHASFPVHDPLLHGRGLPPDPHPPRPTDIG